MRPRGIKYVLDNRKVPRMRGLPRRSVHYSAGERSGWRAIREDAAKNNQICGQPKGGNNDRPDTSRVVFGILGGGGGTVE
jgi:hypothetical protein